MLRPWKYISLIIYTALCLLAGCSSTPPKELAAEEASSQNNYALHPDWEHLPGWQEDDMQGVWKAWQTTCQALSKRREKKWQQVCDIANSVDTKEAQAIRSYFQTFFYPQLLTDENSRTTGLITGYYEPILQGARQRYGVYQTPLYRYPYKKGTNHTTRVLPRREELLQSSMLEGEELVYVDDPVEAAFLQIQGSGRVQLADGGEMRIGFAGSNNQPFQSIAKWLLERREITPAQATMQGIKAWARANPSKREAMLNANPRFIFFRELPADGSNNASGSLGIPLIAERSLAVDPAFIALGAPIFLSTTRPLSNQPLQRLMFAHDTGSAIKGRVRADFYWGVGAAAGELAGRMRQQGSLWVLLPK